MSGTHGRIDYLQLPALDLERSASFYETVFGWSVAWIRADNLFPTLQRAATNGAKVLGRPQLDGGERWLAELDDPAGNRIGVVVPVRTPQPQTLIAVRDVEASSRWYQHLLGLRSDHGGPHYERLLSDGLLVLQLHNVEVEHHHGRIRDPGIEPGNGVLLWFGDVADFDDAVARAEDLGAPVVRPPHRNPPEGEGNGPAHREIWIKDPDGYTVVLASPDGEAFEPE
jgi:predicted enzyme related to lactoylglutathione lyase